MAEMDKDIKMGQKFYTENSGFSTIELVVVLAIVGIISGFALPSYMSWRTNSQLKSSAREINSVFQRTRMEAITDNITLTILFSVSGADNNVLTYTVFQDDGNGGGVAGNRIREANEKEFVTGTMSHVIFDGVNELAVAYNSRGMISKWYNSGADQGSKTGGITIKSDSSAIEYQVTFVRTGHSRIKAY